MDENEITTVAYRLIPRLHDRWSLLVIASSWVADVADATASALRSVHIATAQHAVQKNIDHEFAELMEDGSG